MDIWTLADGQAAITAIAGELVRVVESQEQIATNGLVDSLEEQASLEAMLDAAKPPLPPAALGLNYLLATPFRYPPLRHGSRFGGRYEPALFYAGQGLPPALAETAYYRLVFWSGMAEPPPEGRLTTHHTAFGARYRSAHGLRLQLAPFESYAAQLTDPADYALTQRLGTAMRDAGVQVFEYRSARDPARGVNVALFDPGAFTGRAPVWQQPWLCDTRDDRVSFYNPEAGTTSFERAVFEVDGWLPSPAV